MKGLYIREREREGGWLDHKANFCEKVWDFL